MAFNPNELVIEKVRSVEEYNPETNEFLRRYTQIEDPSLKFTADGTDVTDAMGAPITTFYNAQAGTFDFSNSLFTLDGASSQFGAKKVVATTDNKIQVPVSETITIGADHTAMLKYVPVGTQRAEIKYVQVINPDNTYGKTYEVSPTPGEGKFTLDAAAKKLSWTFEEVDSKLQGIMVNIFHNLDEAAKKITMPEDVTGRVFVNYVRESEEAAMITKSADSIPEVVTLLIHVIFHDPCNVNNVIAGVVRAERAQIDPSSIEISLKSDGKHAMSYKLQKPYCSEDAKLVDIIVSKD